MHAYRKYVEDEMDRRGWKPVDVSRRSGISKQVLSNLLADDRDRLRSMPKDETIKGLAKAFAVPEIVVLRKIGEAMGLPVAETVEVADASRVPDEELVRELSRRLREGGGGHADGSAPKTPAGDSPVSRLDRQRALKGLPESTDDGYEAWAAREGVPANLPDTTTGEGSQDPGTDDPA